jgi:tRNA threonylcarbamoyladenosine biosynthesis protein TsaB
MPVPKIYGVFKNMIILTIRTDNPQAELGLYEDQARLGYETWTAHRQLAETIHSKITQLLEQTGHAWKNIGGLIVFKGPGSFTGLRIGLSTANAIAYGLDIPLTAGTGEQWIEQGISQLLNGDTERIALPDYGSPVHVTAPRK